MMGDDTEGLEYLMADQKRLGESVPHWDQLVTFADGELKSMQFRRQSELKSGYGHGLLKQDFSFDDAHEVVGGITKHFGSFWESECRMMKETLTEMDPKKTGR